jgi:hypothetical protein
MIRGSRIRRTALARFAHRLRTRLRARVRGRPEGQPRILVSWYTNPKYLSPFRLSNAQVNVGPKASPVQPLAPFDGFTPFHQRFDLFEALKSLELPTEYDAIVVTSGADGTNQPCNLDRFDCPKVLCVGDTHHLKAPIRSVIDYASAAGFDFIVCTYNRQHVHWFIEAGFPDVAWLPGLVPNLSRAWVESRRREVCFFGQVGNFHLRRTHLITEIKSRKLIPFVALRGPAEIGADRYASSAVSLNCSLNGDLNLRVFEVLAAGGCLLTDRLSQQSGLGLLLEEGKDYLGYDSVEECIEQARFLLDHEDIALSISRSGYEKFEAQLKWEQRSEQFLEWIFKGRLDSLFRVTDFPRAGKEPALSERIQLYEVLQELQRTQLSPSVLFMDDVPDIQVLDALDLRHLRITLAERKEGSLSNSTAIRERCAVMSHSELAARSWDRIVTRDGKLPPAFQDTSMASDL